MSSKNAGVRLVARFLGVQNTIPVPVPFVHLLGDYTAAAFLSQCLYWGERSGDQEGWFYKTHADWYEELLLTPDQIRRCTRTCEPYLETARRGVLGKTHYRVREHELGEALQMLGNPTSRSGETQHLDVGKPKVQTSGKSTSRRTGNPTSPNKEAKTTAETTAEEGAQRAAAPSTGQVQNDPSGTGGADRAEAPDGARGSHATAVSGTQSTGGHEPSNATSTEEVPARPGEVALRSAMGEKFYGELLAEDPDRAAWGDLTTERIGELRRAAKAEAKEKNLDAWRTPFIRLLDHEIVRTPESPSTPAKVSTSDLVRARLQGAKP